MPLFPAIVTPPILISEVLMAGGGTGVLTAQTAYMYEYALQTSVTVIGMRWKAGSVAASTTDAGIYDINGNLLGHTGATNNVASTNMNIALLANVTLSPGRYFLVLLPGSSTDTYSRLTLLGTAGSAIVPAFTLANASVNGVLPATLSGWTAAQLCPAMAAAISGGI